MERPLDQEYQVFLEIYFQRLTWTQIIPLETYVFVVFKLKKLHKLEQQGFRPQTMLFSRKNDTIQ